MDIIKFNVYVKEEVSADIADKLKEDNYTDVKKDLVEITQASTNSSDLSIIKDVINSYIDGNDESVIVGLVNDSDIYDFYIKYTTSIDAILSSVDYFDQSPNSLNANGLYDYIVQSTRNAIKILFKQIVSEI